MSSVHPTEQMATEQMADKPMTDAIASQTPENQLESPVSFSIIIETENLASADLPGLFRSLDALQGQTLSPPISR